MTNSLYSGKVLMKDKSARKKHELSLLDTKRFSLLFRGGELITAIMNDCKKDFSMFFTCKTISVYGKFIKTPMFLTN